MREIRPIRSEKDYDAALAEIEPYFAHEAEHWSIAAPDAPDALRERMEVRGLTQQDLVGGR